MYKYVEGKYLTTSSVISIGTACVKPREGQSGDPDLEELDGYP